MKLINRLNALGVLTLVSGLFLSVSSAQAQGPGVYKDGIKILDFGGGQLSTAPDMQKVAPSAASLGQEVRQRLFGPKRPDRFGEPNKFFETVAKCRELIDRVTSDGATGPSRDADLDRLVSLREQLTADNKTYLARLNDIDQGLQLGGYSPGKRSRQTEVIQTQRRIADRLLGLLSDLDASKNSPDVQILNAALEGLRRFMTEYRFQEDPPLVNANPAPAGMEVKKADVVMRSELPAMSKITETPLSAEAYGPGDLAQTIDVRFTPEITDLAAQLHHSAPEIYAWVRNNITFEPYLGSRKGSAQTYHHLRGNDYDQASLLIALLRVSGIPARYARGMVEMPIEQVTNWLGVDDPETAATVLNTAGFQTTLILDPNPVALRCKRVWVEAYVPYLNYRGAVNDSTGFIWAPLDPAVKQYTYLSSINLVDEINLDAKRFVDNYLLSVNPKTPVEAFKQLLLDSLALHHPGATEADLTRRRTVISETFDILPGTHPYMLVSRDSVFSEIPAGMRYQIRFHLFKDATNYLDYTTSLPEIVEKQVTISWVGATPEDQHIIDTAGGVFGVDLPYVVDVNAVLKIDGCEVARGANFSMMGITLNSDMHFTAPTGGSNQLPVIHNVIIAGNYQAIGIDTEDAFPTTFGSVQTTCTEDYLGQTLHQAALTYLNNVDIGGDKLADLMHMVVINDISEAIVENTVKVLFSGPSPITFEWTGMVVDADRKIVGPFAFNGDDLSKAYMRIGGADGSSQENRLFETVFAEEAVSTIKILQLANTRGIPIFEMTPALVPQLHQPASVVTAIQSAMALGHKVIIPRDSMTYYEWKGTGYIDMDTATCAAGYIISGGHAGGATVQTWLIAYPDLLCILPIGPIAVEPASTSDLYCSEDDSKWTFIVPTIEYWGYDDDGKCKQLGAENDKRFPVQLSIKEIAHKWGPGKYKFKLGVASDCGCTMIEKEVTIVEIDLMIFKPAVINTAQPEISEANEDVTGAQTFVNLDNDDNDNKFDTGTLDTDVPGENEMCKVRLRLRPKDLNVGSVKLFAITGGSNIKVWTAANKGAAYNLGDAVATPGGMKIDGDYLVKDLWVEGIGPSTAQFGTKLKIMYTPLSTWSDVVYLTLLGIDRIEWAGKGNSLGDGDVLDADPNWPAGLAPGAMRVFPDARLVGGLFGSAPEPNPRNQVDVLVTLNVAPVEPVTLAFRSFDTDDPTGNTAPLDDETAAEDNRGTVPAREGEFPDSPGALTLEHIFVSYTGSFAFRVTKQPGDNFRMVGSGDRQFLYGLENNENNLGAANVDKQRITVLTMGGTPADREIRQADHYASKILTVWRKLRVENDSMGDVVNNYREGNIIGFNTGVSNTAIELTVSNSLRDGSRDLDNSTDSGRFHLGFVKVANTHDIGPIAGNGQFRVRRGSGTNVCATPIPFTAKDKDWVLNSTMSGTVTLIDNGSVRLTLNITAHSETPIDWPGFIGGTIKIGSGPAMNITAVDGPNSRVTVNGLQIPYRIIDDDRPNGMDVPDPDLSGLLTAYAPAYILPVKDFDYHQGNLVFIPNIGGDAADSVHRGWKFDLRPYEANDNFWVVYVRGAMQHTEDTDDDPNAVINAAGVLLSGEGGIYGIADAIGPPVGRGQGANVYTEMIRAAEGYVANPAQGLTPGHIVAHEIGHVFGGMHSDCMPPDVAPCASAGLMAQSWQRNNPNFNVITLDRFRRIDHP